MWKHELWSLPPVWRCRWGGWPSRSTSSRPAPCSVELWRCGWRHPAPPPRRPEGRRVLINRSPPASGGSGRTCRHIHVKPYPAAQKCATATANDETLQQQQDTGTHNKAASNKFFASGLKEVFLTLLLSSTRNRQCCRLDPPLVFCEGWQHVAVEEEEDEEQSRSSLKGENFKKVSATSWTGICSVSHTFIRPQTKLTQVCMYTLKREK